MKSKVLICLDRDGTLIHDNKYFLGKTKNWKKKIKFLPKVVEGLKTLNKVPNSILYIISNQTGIAIKDFPFLTETQANKVTRHIIMELKKRGARIDGFAHCPHVPQSYVKKHPNRSYERKFVCNCNCIKPKTGMISKALQEFKLKKSKTKIYVIGNRLSDVKTALNIGGFGILVPFKNEPGHIGKVKKLKSRNKFVAKDFIGAAKFILRRESS